MTVVTGVQTCALPICHRCRRPGQHGHGRILRLADQPGKGAEQRAGQGHDHRAEQRQPRRARRQGRQGAGKDHAGQGDFDDDQQNADHHPVAQGRDRPGGPQVGEDVAEAVHGHALCRSGCAGGGAGTKRTRHRRALCPFYGQLATSGAPCPLRRGGKPGAAGAVRIIPPARRELGRGPSVAGVHRDYSVRAEGTSPPDPQPPAGADYPARAKETSC